MSAEPTDRWRGRTVDAWRREWNLPCLEIYRRIGSTNDRGRELAEAGVAAGTVVLAEEQSAGRGQQGRRWLAPPNTGLLLSMVLRYQGGDTITPGAAPLRIALAVRDAVHSATGREPRIKWPNDILLDGRKLAGILCEGASDSGGSAGFIVAGIGINVGQQPEDWPPELRETATSLRIQLGRHVDHVYLAGWLLDRLRQLARARPADPLSDAELRQLEAHDALRGRCVHIETDDTTLTGTAEGIEPDGSLRLRLPDDVRLIRSGSVRLAC